MYSNHELKACKKEHNESDVKIIIASDIYYVIYRKHGISGMAGTE